MAEFTREEVIQVVLNARKFEGTDLQGLDLSRADLEGAGLFEANLREANLSQAILSGANLRWTDLRKATYCTKTKWPARFDPKRAGARLVD